MEIGVLMFAVWNRVMRKVERKKNGCGQAGQGTVELAAVLPAVVVVAIIALNACTFFSECAAFDREFRQAVRVHATSPSYNENTSEIVARLQQYLSEQHNKDNENIDVWVAGEADGCVRYAARMQYFATLFGAELKKQVFGVSMPSMSHEVQMYVDPYNPSVFFG